MKIIFITKDSDGEIFGWSNKPEALAVDITNQEGVVWCVKNNSPTQGVYICQTTPVTDEEAKASLQELSF